MGIKNTRGKKTRKHIGGDTNKLVRFDSLSVEAAATPAEAPAEEVPAKESNKENGAENKPIEEERARRAAREKDKRMEGLKISQQDEYLKKHYDISMNELSKNIFTLDPKILNQFFTLIQLSFSLLTEIYIMKEGDYYFLTKVSLDEIKKVINMYHNVFVSKNQHDDEAQKQQQTLEKIGKLIVDANKIITNPVKFEDDDDKNDVEKKLKSFIVILEETYELVKSIFRKITALSREAREEENPLDKQLGEESLKSLKEIYSKIYNYKENYNIMRTDVINIRAANVDTKQEDDARVLLGAPRRRGAEQPANTTKMKDNQAKASAEVAADLEAAGLAKREEAAAALKRGDEALASQLGKEADALLAPMLEQKVTNRGGLNTFTELAKSGEFSRASEYFPGVSNAFNSYTGGNQKISNGGRRTRKKRHSYKNKSKKIRRTRVRRKTHTYKKKSKKLRKTRRRR